VGTVAVGLSQLAPKSGTLRADGGRDIASEGALIGSRLSFGGQLD
jgi:hypothetical protein